MTDKTNIQLCIVLARPGRWPINTHKRNLRLGGLVIRVDGRQSKNLVRFAGHGMSAQLNPFVRCPAFPDINVGCLTVLKSVRTVRLCYTLSTLVADLTAQFRAGLQGFAAPALLPLSCRSSEPTTQTLHTNVLLCHHKVQQFVNKHLYP